MRITSLSGPFLQNLNTLRQIFTFFILLIISTHILAQGPDAEFRATWVASVYNIDWPVSQGNAQSQKEEFLEILDSLKSTNMNAAVLQIRPTADALYHSSYEPWSEWLTGERGNDPGYDPLEFAISEAHKRGIELHGWVNPYRFETSSGRYAGKEGKVISEHPDWIIDVDGKTYFNPGNPEVTQYLKLIIGDILENYDIDGLCFDDYFYPAGISTEDSEEYLLFGNEGESVADFRRRSVNQMIAEVYDTIKQVKPWVRFGVSPAGIYSTDPSAAATYKTSLPSGITGRDNYNIIYCDPLAWIKQGTLDYLSPQLYWKRGGGQDFNTLIEWWSEECNKNGIACYPSLGTYRLSGDQPPSSSSQEWETNEILSQIDLLRDHRDKGTLGLVFYSQGDLERVEGLTEMLRNEIFDSISIWPEFLSEGELSPLPTGISASTFGRKEKSPVSSFIWEGEPTNRYWIEGADEKGTVTFEAASYEESVLLPADTITTFYRVYSINRFGRVNPSFYSTEILNVETPEVVHGTSKEKLASFESLRWNYTENASVYYIEISDSPEFLDTYHTSGLIRDTSILIEELALKGEREYYWKVFACNGNGCKESVVSSFETGFPASVSIQAPEPDQMFVPLEPELIWNPGDDLLQYNVQIATDSTFENIQMDSIVVNQNSINSIPLNKWTEYFLRIRGINDYGMGEWSEIVVFTTTTDIPERPVFISPEDSVEVDNPILLLEWTKVDFANGYRLMIADDTSFADVFVDTILSRYQRDFDFELPGEGPYFARVCGSYEGGCGEWSDTLRFSRTMTSIVLNSYGGAFIVFPNPTDRFLWIRRINNFGINEKTIKIEILDLAGKVVKNKDLSFESNGARIDISSLNKGFYFLRIIGKKGKGSGVQRFIKM